MGKKLKKKSVQKTSSSVRRAISCNRLRRQGLQMDQASPSAKGRLAVMTLGNFLESLLSRSSFKATCGSHKSHDVIFSFFRDLPVR